MIWIAVIGTAVLFFGAGCITGFVMGARSINRQLTEAMTRAQEEWKA